MKNKRQVEGRNQTRTSFQSSLDHIQESILHTIIYQDLFGCPLTKKQCYRRLIKCKCSYLEYLDALLPLIGTYLGEHKEYIFIKDRKNIVENRRIGKKRSKPYVRQAYKYSNIVSYIPFVEMVSLSGSLAHYNITRGGDIDFFLVLSKDGFEFAKSIVSFASTLLNLISKYKICPNYMISRGALEINIKNLYTATEIVSIYPLVNSQCHEEFIEKNKWVFDFFPNYQKKTSRLTVKNWKKPEVSLIIERLVDINPDFFKKVIKNLYVTQRKLRGKSSEKEFFNPDKPRKKGYMSSIFSLYKARVEEVIGSEKVGFYFGEENLSDVVDEAGANRLHMLQEKYKPELC